jgi:hypothetical protein
MSRLQAALHDRERAIQRGVSEPSAEKAEVDVQLQSLLGGMARIPASYSASIVATDARPLDVVLAQLRTQLAEGDGEVEELWRMNKGRLVGLYSPRQVAAIDHAVEQWDFDEALHILDNTYTGGGSQ